MASRARRPRKRGAAQLLAATASGTGGEGIHTRYDEPGASPGFVLWQVASIWQRAVRAALTDVGLTHAQFVLLASAGWLEGQAAAGAGEPVTQALVAAHARVDAVMTSEVLRTLEGKGLVRRLPHPTDARARRIALTAAGRRTSRRAVALVEAADAVFFGERGPELRALARLICRDRE